MRLKLLIHIENSNSTVKSEGTACGCVRRSKRNCTSRPDGPAGVQVRRGPFRFIRARHEAASLSLSDPARRRVQGRAQASGRTARLAGPLHSKRAMLRVQHWHPRSLRPPRATLQAALSTVTVLLLARKWRLERNNVAPRRAFCRRGHLSSLSGFRANLDSLSTAA